MKLSRSSNKTKKKKDGSSSPKEKHAATSSKPSSRKNSLVNSSTQAPQPPRAVAVIGAGYLGSAIAAELALCGLRVHVFDGGSKAAAVLGKIDHSLSLNRQTSTATREQTDAAHTLVKIFGSVEEAVVEVDLVVEAIPDDLVAKRTLFELLDTCTGPDTLLTTNALTIPLHQIAEGMRKESRHRVVGLRFLMPVTLIPMVELSGDADRLGNSQAMDQVASYMAALGKFCFLFRAPPSRRSRRSSSSSSNAEDQATYAAEASGQRLRLTAEEALTHQLRETRLRAVLGVAPRDAPRPRGEEAEDNSDTCVVCLDRKADAVVVSCGHRAFCLPCAVRLNTDRAPCPLCRTTMRGVYEEVKKKETRHR